MTNRSAQAVRALTFLAFGLVLVLGLRACFFSTDDGNRLETVETSRGELSILEALSAPASESLVVRGFLFYDDKRGLRLCTYREKADPPECQEPFLDVEGVDRSTFNFDGDGHDDRLDLDVSWMEDSVALVGMINGRVLTVEDVLQ